MRVRFGLAFAVLGIAIAACADSAADPAAPPINLPERDAGAKADGSSTDGSSSGDGASIEVQSCTNGVKDADETDVDCGGPGCAPCVSGKACTTRRDCSSLVCLNNTCNSEIGCSDGTREGYPVASYKNIAACGGAWSVPGLLAEATKAPACDRNGGNDGTNPSGSGCNVADLCQVGWHVCASGNEVASKSSGLGCSPVDGTANAFFATRQSGPGDALCASSGANDLFGCGGIGSPPDANGSCAPLSRASGNLCASIPTTFACGVDGLAEANNVTKANGEGGVLCCRD